MDVDTKKKLNALSLNELIEIIEFQDENPAMYFKLSFDERFAMIIDEYYVRKHNDKIKRRIKHASLRYPEASVQTVDCANVGISESKLKELASLKFISSSTNVIICGVTGTGKTYLSNAIAKQACLNDIKTLYIRLYDLLVASDNARIEGKLESFKLKISRYTLLVIDEWLTHPLTPNQVQFLYELIDMRYNCTSTIFISQYDTGDWHKIISKVDKVYADSILDRTVHNAIKILPNDINVREIMDSKKYQG